MKSFSLLFILLISLQVKAKDDGVDPYEDTPENLAPQIEKSDLFKRTSPIWTYYFERQNQNSSPTLLSSKNENSLVKPASTMKIFTGWWSYQLRSRDNQYLLEMLTKSVNSMADETAKMMGGAREMVLFYKSLGLELTPTRFNSADGSGLSYDNKATCKAEIELLRLIHQDVGYAEFKTFMAQPGQRGTLEKRLLDLKGKVFAKTGTLNKTAALAGFMETPKGTVLFCVMADYLKMSLPNARAEIDRLVRLNFSKNTEI